MPTAYLSLGSNLGDRFANLTRALARLDSDDIRVRTTSSVYETAPVGETLEPVPHYLNLVAEVDTMLSPDDLLKRTQAVEAALGRVPTFRWGPRAIDIDILLFDDLSFDSAGLQIPHPRMTERAFVLVPLHEIAPNIVLPDGTIPPQHLGKPEVAEQQLSRFEPQEAEHGLLPI
jgi:2-amino-4-hydroxy-6-hydroxymethyldihydropteridine diphosphokinase